ncbi:hypothetical protein AAC387_Pa07g3189 [Persea americana]
MKPLQNNCQAILSQRKQYVELLLVDKDGGLIHDQVLEGLTLQGQATIDAVGQLGRANHEHWRLDGKGWS